MWEFSCVKSPYLTKYFLCLGTSLKFVGFFHRARFKLPGVLVGPEDFYIPQKPK